MRNLYFFVSLLAVFFLFSSKGFSDAPSGIKARAYLRASVSSAGIFSTKAFYNGTFAGHGYDGILSACNSEFKGSQPCNNYNLLEAKFWQYLIFPIGAWILNPSVACLAATTNSTDVDGTCVFTASDYGNQVTTCSCNMIIPVCCVKP